MKICIIGSGNIGTLLAAELTRNGAQITVITSKPQDWSDEIAVYNGDSRMLFKVSGFHITDRLSEISDADQIWITYPAFLLPDLSERMLPFTSKGQMILCIPGCGAEFSFEPHIEKGCILCGLQRVHCIARLKEYGKSVFALGRKSGVVLGAIPSSCAEHYATIVSDLLDMPCDTLDNYLAVTLTPSNPILHTSRLYAMFRDYLPGVEYDHNILFYEEWTDDASSVMLKCDEELQSICAALPQMDLRAVKSLKLHYESDTVEKMTKKIRSIQAFRGLLSPMTRTPTGWIPDFSSRYFTADFSYGLKIMIDIGKAVGVSTPQMNEVWAWYVRTCPAGTPHFRMNAEKADELYRIYHRKVAI